MGIFDQDGRARERNSKKFKTEWAFSVAKQREISYNSLMKCLLFQMWK